MTISKSYKHLLKQYNVKDVLSIKQDLHGVHKIDIITNDNLRRSIYVKHNFK